MNTPATQTKTVSKPRPFRATFSGKCAVTGVAFNAGAEIYKNPDGAGYVKHVVSAVPAVWVF